MTGAEGDMRELSEQEMDAVAGGLSNGYQPWRPPNPLTVTFGTPVEPGFEVPGVLPGWHF